MGKTVDAVNFEQMDNIDHMYFYINVHDKEDFDAFLNCDFMPDFNEPVLHLLQSLPLQQLSSPPFTNPRSTSEEEYSLNQMKAATAPTTALLSPSQTSQTLSASTSAAAGAGVGITEI